MRSIFIDTSAIVALFDRTDRQHERSKELLEVIRKNRIRPVLSDYIFDESVTTALSHTGHEAAVKIGRFILESSMIDFVWLNTGLKMKAWEYFTRHSDKGWSFTDCTSFVLMHQKRIERYFAFDNHFSQAGFLDFSTMTDY